ncbi:MAG: peptidoglycan editing factor PgeF [Trueperaceae bacterium]|nr:peptidoglycan editing factor PgeF [Trueperaceae bacterium]
MTKALVTSEFLHTPHAFSTRQDGVSEGVYSSFNLGISTGDDRTKVEQNRQAFLDAFGLTKAQVCALEQVHGNRVVEAQPGWFDEDADASVSNQADLLLIIGTADCLPILFHDPVKAAIGAAHAGWRGSALGISQKVVEKMTELYGSSPKDIRVVIGPCIQGACYQVGEDVINEFRKAQFPEAVYQSDAEGKYRLDLVAANRWLLEAKGVKEIHSLEECTHCDQERYYSHRRDGLKRGSHWSAIMLKAQ